MNSKELLENNTSNEGEWSVSPRPRPISLKEISRKGRCKSGSFARPEHSSQQDGGGEKFIPEQFSEYTQ